MTKRQLKNLKIGDLIVDVSGTYSIVEIADWYCKVKLVEANNPGWATVTYPITITNSLIKQMKKYSAFSKKYYKLYYKFKVYLHFLYMKWIKHHCRHFCAFCKQRMCDCYTDYLNIL